MKKVTARVRVTQGPVHPENIKLDSFLKLAGACLTGGEAKEMICSGGVRVNSEVVTVRGKKLHPGDRVTAAGKLFELQAAPLRRPEGPEEKVSP